jgi:co-chaperonin GroES (HSP10)
VDSSLEHRENIVLADDQVLFTLQLDLGARVLAEEDPVTLAYIQGPHVAVGNGKVNDDGNLRPLDVHKGDRILFGKYSGTEIQLEGEEHLIIREDDVLAVLE